MWIRLEAVPPRFVGLADGARSEMLDRFWIDLLFDGGEGDPMSRDALLPPPDRLMLLAPAVLRKHSNKLLDDQSSIRRLKRQAHQDALCVLT